MNIPQVAIIGYGKMGHEIENQLLKIGATITATIDNENEWEIKEKELKNSDVAIEFSIPSMAVKNMYRCFDIGLPVVCGTTGWSNEEEQVIDYCKKTSHALIFGSNFSIGANLFFKINELTAKLMNRQTQYDVMIEETHHIAKKDIPSGTAITIANTIMNQIDRKNGWTLQNEDTLDKINITAHRIGNVPGIHTVQYQSAYDSIVLTHTAFNRTIFAEGAVRAAQWLIEHGGIHRFQDIFMEV